MESPPVDEVNIARAIEAMDVLHQAAKGSELGSVIMSVLTEIDRLRRWKTEAMTVISSWEEVHEALGCPGKIGDRKSVASKLEVERLKSQQIS